MSKNRKITNDLGFIFSTHDSFKSFFEEEQDATEIAPKAQVVRVQLDTKLKAGKSATKIMGLNLSEEKMNDLTKQLKQKCGVGGSVKEGQIIIQGDHVNKIIGMLIEMGYKNTKRTGG